MGINIPKLSISSEDKSRQEWSVVDQNNEKYRMPEDPDDNKVEN